MSTARQENEPETETHNERERSRGQEQSRHQDLITLTILTIATAALGAAILLADLSNIPIVSGERPKSPSAWVKTGLEGTTVVAYAILATTAGLGLFQNKNAPEEDVAHKRRFAFYTYLAFMIIALLMAGILATNLIGAIATSAANGKPG